MIRPGPFSSRIFRRKSALIAVGLIPILAAGVVLALPREPRAGLEIVNRTGGRVSDLVVTFARLEDLERAAPDAEDAIPGHGARILPTARRVEADDLPPGARATLRVPQPAMWMVRVQYRDEVCGPVRVFATFPISRPDVRLSQAEIVLDEADPYEHAGYRYSTELAVYAKIYRAIRNIPMRIAIAVRYGIF